MKVFACLWDGKDLPHYSGQRFDIRYVENMQRNLAATNPGAELHIVADGAYHDAVAAIEGVTAHSMLGIDCGGWTPMFEAFAPHLWPAHGERHLLVGLDTVFLSDITWLFEWDKAPVGLPLDPYFAPLPCNAVTSFNQNGAAILWRAYQEQRTRNKMADFEMFGRPSEMVLKRTLYMAHGWPPLEDEPERILSWKVHVMTGAKPSELADVVYFHGKEKPTDLPEGAPVRAAWEGVHGAA